MSNRSAELFDSAHEVLAGGVSRNTLLRPLHPIYVKQASGCRVVDVDNVERIDFSNNMASLIHGHAHPAIVDAVTQQLQRGSAFALATEVEIEYARLLCGRSPGFDKIRFMNSGTEAVMAALKAARAFTGKYRIAKVEGAYHGAYDYAEISQAPGPDSWGRAKRPSSVPLSTGTPTGVAHDVVVMPFNDPDSAIEILNRHRRKLACVLVDPMPHRVGLVPAQGSYVRALRDWTRDNDVLLVVDEVITFRTEVGGMEERYGIQPDLTALGKIIGGGFPVGAVAGREEVMEVFIAKGGLPPRLPQSGTFSGNPITMTAGLVAMQLFDAEAVARLNHLGDLARSGIEEAISISGVPASISGAGSLFRIHMRSEPPRDYRSGFPTPEENQTLTRFVNGLYDEGIVPINTGTCTLSTAMTVAEIDRFSEAVLASFRRLEVEVPA